MKDTHPAMMRKYLKMIREKTSEERLVMGCSMYSMSKRLVLSSILNKDPAISKIALRRQIFLRFYSNDFNASFKKKIVDCLAHGSNSSLVK